MKLSFSILLGFSLLLSFVSAAQDPIAIGYEVPKSFPSTKDELLKPEKYKTLSKVIDADKEGNLPAGRQDLKIG